MDTEPCAGVQTFELREKLTNNLVLNSKVVVEQIMSGNVFRSLGSVSGWGSITSIDVSSSLKIKMAVYVCVCDLGGMAYNTVLSIS